MYSVRRFRYSQLLVLLLVMGVFIPCRAYAVSGNIPLNSPVYRYLETLNSYGLLPSYLAGTRPVTWSEANRLMEEARAGIKVRGEEEDRAVPKGHWSAFRALERAVLSRFEGDTGLLSTGILKSAELELFYLDGDPSSVPDINASQHALVFNNGGIDPDEGGTASVSMELEGIAGPAAVQLFPRLTTGGEDRQVFHRGVFKLGSDRFEISLGRESLWWGQGSHGGLYLTNNARPLPMVRMTNASPTELPWIFKYLGPFRYGIFLSRLEEDRAVPEPYFSGIRTNFRPFDRFELGMSIMIMTGGEGRPDVSFADLFDILFGENDTVDDRSNKIAGIDFRFNLDGWQLYGELGGEDEAGYLPSKDAFLLGIYVPQLTGSADLRVEYADLAPTEEIAGAWYRHGAYTDGYTYEGRIIGHHVGGDGKDLFTEVTFPVGESGRGRVGVALEQRGVHLQPAVEKHFQVSAGWERRLGREGREWTLKVGAAADRVSNREHVSGQGETNGYVTFSLGREM